MTEPKEIKKLYDTLLASDSVPFPKKRQPVKAPKEQGVYIIYSPEEKTLHVGRTNRAKGGLKQRLHNHLSNASSFSNIYLKQKGQKGDILREGYKFKCIVENDPKNRAYLEALTTGLLCPDHIGTGEKVKSN